MASAKYNSDEARWKAVSDNRSNADGVFYYAVITTGIYCRLGCRLVRVCIGCLTNFWSGYTYKLSRCLYDTNGNPVKIRNGPAAVTEDESCLYHFAV